jgi:hypothetical protein
VFLQGSLETSSLEVSIVEQVLFQNVGNWFLNTYEIGSVASLSARVVLKSYNLKMHESCSSAEKWKRIG